MKEKLQERRFLHSLNVADAAVKLAERYGEDTERAYICGLLHDIEKN
ncbi:MAG: HD domain-containing protein, partial [Clostridia bacterium]|nr:HD domain-containing protein [Clostridia bacterium]